MTYVEAALFWSGIGGAFIIGMVMLGGILLWALFPSSIAGVVAISIGVVLGIIAGSINVFELSKRL